MFDNQIQRNQNYFMAIPISKGLIGMAFEFNSNLTMTKLLTASASFVRYADSMCAHYIVAEYGQTL